MRPARHRGADVGGEHAHVRAAGADDAEPHVRRIERQEIERVDPDRARLRLERLARPRRLVELAPADLHRAVGGRPLERLPHERVHRIGDLLLGRIDRRLADHLAVGVQRVRLDAEPERPLVGLREVAEESEQPGRATHPDQEQPGRHRIERPRMARPSWSRGVRRTLSTTSWEVTLGGLSTRSRPSTGVTTGRALGARRRRAARSSPRDRARTCTPPRGDARRRRTRTPPPTGRGRHGSARSP